MSKTYANTKKSQIGVIRYAIEKGPEARFKFKGNIFAFTNWAARKWNKAHPDDKITKQEVGLTPEIAEKLHRRYFLPKKKV